MNLPDHLADKAAAFPEVSYGVQRVTLLLADGHRLTGVFLAWGRQVIKVGSRQMMSTENPGFSVGDIVDVFSEV